MQSQDEAERMVVYAVGDVAPLRDDPGSIFDRVRDVLRSGDAAFCQLEITLSGRGSPLPQARLAMQADPMTARALKEAGFTVVSFASNHCMDWGREGFADTIEALEDEGLQVIGAGADLEEARRPALVESHGTRIAFLAYNSILPQGYWAEADRPGCAPLRAHTIYEQVEHDQPGTPCKIHTFPHREDLGAMVDDIRAAKASADVVVVSLHWGIHFIPAVIADYQRDIARAAIDAGADLILGHHAHILKGAEIYRGKTIFYSLCNFALDLAPTEKMLASKRHQELVELNEAWQPDPEYPTYYLPPDSRMTMIVRIEASGGRLGRVSFLPVTVNKQSQPEIVVAGTEEFDRVVAYMEEITRSETLNGAFVVEGDEVVVREPGQDLGTRASVDDLMNETSWATVEDGTHADR
jgi:poly-gamma-glutamate capsule biosynthesis protein CapA/YwtB (metallophosphatase superfamily)